MTTKRKNKRREESPLTMDEILERDNVAASEPVPVEIAERLASNKFVLSSDDRDFDPRKYFTRSKGSSGTWELSTSKTVRDWPCVETMERVKPGSLKRAARGAGIIEAYRPPWQPYIYHPKTMSAHVEPQTLKRKSGAKVRPHAVFNLDDRDIYLPQGYPWRCIGSVFRNFGSGWQPSGTGTLVGSRTVLCSGHMIPWGQPGVGIQFVPGYYSTANVSRAVGGKRFPSFVTDVRGYDAGARAGWDIAVMRLADPFGDGLGTFGARTYNDDWEDEPRWTLVGYPSEFGTQVITSPFQPTVITSIPNNGNFPTRQFGISVEDDDSDGDALELEHHGDSSPGNSGGPLFGHWPDGTAYVIGVESGAEIPPDLGFFFGARMTNIAAGGHAMIDLIRWARETWV
ncbi:MAG TPA: trypsin-like serine protease [Pyrinomonadaceae bacterium]|jgi:V8-like Glu-specific endopeptidase